MHIYIYVCVCVYVWVCIEIARVRALPATKSSLQMYEKKRRKKTKTLPTHLSVGSFIYVCTRYPFLPFRLEGHSSTDHVQWVSDGHRSHACR